jgi:inorganic pyrophosphatase
MLFYLNSIFCFNFLLFFNYNNINVIDYNYIMKEEEEPMVNVFIEISKNSHIKYEYSPELNALVCDRILHTPFKYEFNYGFIPDTLSEDGDPLDAVIIMDDVLVPGCYIKCRFLGVLYTSDDHGNDPKIIMCPADNVDPTYKALCNIDCLPELTANKIHYFFSHYKDLENKRVNLGGWGSKKDAINIFFSSLIK